MRTSKPAASIRACARKRWHPSQFGRLAARYCHLRQEGRATKYLRPRALRYTLGRMAGYQKLLVLLDLSEDSDQVAVAARDLAAYSKAAIVALHIVEFIPVEPMGDSLMPTRGDRR